MVASGTRRPRHTRTFASPRCSKPWGLGEPQSIMGGIPVTSQLLFMGYFCSSHSLWLEWGWVGQGQETLVSSEVNTQKETLLQGQSLLTSLGMFFLVRQTCLENLKSIISKSLVRGQHRVETAFVSRGCCAPSPVQHVSECSLPATCSYTETEGSTCLCCCRPCWLQLIPVPDNIRETGGCQGSCSSENIK